jgi:dolichol-phosphate mannosyltransferase
MADGSDAPGDVVKYVELLERGYDCVFGSRFTPGAQVRDYPTFKRVVNRTANLFVRLLFRHGYNDTTNAFKAYRREVIETVQPLLSNHFNLTVELPLKAIVRGHSYAICPISWTNRTAGASKLKLQEMGSRYLFIVLYVWLEHHLSGGDYRRPGFVGHPVRVARPSDLEPTSHSDRRTHPHSFHVHQFLRRARASTHRTHLAPSRYIDDAKSVERRETSSASGSEATRDV